MAKLVGCHRLATLVPPGILHGRAGLRLIDWLVYIWEGEVNSVMKKASKSAFSSLVGCSDAVRGKYYTVGDPDPDPCSVPSAKSWVNTSSRPNIPACAVFGFIYCAGLPRWSSRTCCYSVCVSQFRQHSRLYLVLFWPWLVHWSHLFLKKWFQMTHTSYSGYLWVFQDHWKQQSCMFSPVLSLTLPWPWLVRSPFLSRSWCHTWVSVLSLALSRSISLPSLEKCIHLVSVLTSTSAPAGRNFL